MADPLLAAAIPPPNDEPLLFTKTGFNPTVDDVIEVRRVLTGLGVGNHTLPMEIALMIISLASYHPRISSANMSEAIYRADQFWRPGPDASVAELYLAATTLPVSHSIARAMSITFQMKGADQGWADNGGEGTYFNSHTWYEASILRPRSQAASVAALTGPDVRNFRTPPEARDHLEGQGWDMVEDNGAVVWRVHNNVTASHEYRHYKVDWVAGVPTEVGDPRAMGDGEGFLELLRPNDVIVLWARAEEQAWVNKTRGATIEIEYEVL
ncbi:hypothetical protein ONZ43_g3271 [Nemania bipapillata]|uniref:Uncharacterized protein n=1 Tax=Nemania bipapillata TaxID=110536 RepID=A0ACC2IXE9_9PEZI|nr:hypothetical protein ONZ43_g3271 [Nemania bipapillata]